MSISSPQPSSQSGVVSIFVVIFFMIFVSVIAVGFVKVANDDLSQSIDSDLSASALASAQSGAEDGKRLLIFCRTKTAGNPTLQAECDNVLGSTDCRAFLNSSALMTALKVDKDPVTGDGRVSANSAYEQRYTCMTVKTLTDSVEGLSVKKETSELIPLVAETGKNFTNVNFSWHATADARDGAVNVFRTNTSLPADDQWKSGTASYPAAMRLEFIAYPKSGIDLNKLDEDTRTVFLVPGSGVASTTTVNLNTADIRDTDPAPGRQYNPNAASEKMPILVRCQSGTEYACSVNIQVAGTLPSASYNYFLRVSSLYSSAYIKAEMFNGAMTAANRVRFDNVQPVIDVTGRTNDVFRRIQTRVQFDANMYLPQYALEASEICKDMVVADTGANSSDACNPAGMLGATALDGNAQIGTSDPNPSTGGTGNTTPVDNRPCYIRNGWDSDICYTARVYNVSQNDPGAVLRCEWNWGDGTIDTYPGTDQHCQRSSTRYSHLYKKNSPGDFTTRSYTIRLTNYMVSGKSIPSQSYTVELPY